jgi:hypothetical protein
VQRSVLLMYVKMRMVGEIVLTLTSASCGCVSAWEGRLGRFALYAFEQAPMG